LSPASSITTAARSFSASSATSSTPSRSLSQSGSRPLSTMSTQPEHPTLLIPGPIEFDDAVLNSMSHYRYVTGMVYSQRCSPMLTYMCQQREPRWSWLCCNLRRDPRTASQPLPDHRPLVAAFHHLRFRYTGLGSRRC
jgi:alanine-glyoxylate transaminase/serine-glyoxylate transaminase/serine-pyruvate transaminase